MSFTPEDRASFEAARGVLEPIFDRMKTGTGNQPLSILKEWAEFLAGWLPTLGRLAALADGEARVKKAAAARRRAEVYGVAVKASSARAAEQEASMDLERQRLLEAWAEAKGESGIIKAFWQDTLETLNGVKKAIEAEKTMRGLG